MKVALARPAPDRVLGLPRGPGPHLENRRPRKEQCVVIGGTVKGQYEAGVSAGGREMWAPEF